MKIERKRERERKTKAFVALIYLQQRKLFIASSLADGDSSDSNETDTYHYGKNDKL